jgi:serine/threonine protein kinase
MSPLSHREQASGSSRILGSGGHGTVRLVQPRSGDRPIAVKDIPKRYEGSRSQALREASIHRTLNGHPRICRLESVSEDEASVYLSLEYIEGKELLDELLLGRCEDERRAANIMLQLFEALAHCHARGIVHRDVKPENVMLQETPSSGLEVKLIDFGLAAPTGQRQEPDLVGTLPYMAPEVTAAAEAGATTTVSPGLDLWSAGVVLHCLLVGELLPNQVRTGQQPVDVAGGKWASYDVSPAARDLVSRLLAVDPSERLSAEAAANHPWVTGSTTCLQPPLPMSTEDVAGPSAELFGKLVREPTAIRAMQKQSMALFTDERGCVGQLEVQELVAAVVKGEGVARARDADRCAKEALGALASTRGSKRGSRDRVGLVTWLAWLGDALRAVEGLRAASRKAARELFGSKASTCAPTEPLSDGD